MSETIKVPYSLRLKWLCSKGILGSILKIPAICFVLSCLNMECRFTFLWFDRCAVLVVKIFFLNYYFLFFLVGERGGLGYLQHGIFSNIFHVLRCIQAEVKFPAGSR